MLAYRCARVLRPAGVGAVRCAVSAEMVKQLRDKSGAPIMDCKKALQVENVQGDMSKALEWLRKKGMSVAQAKAGRKAAEGLVAVHLGADKCVLVEVNSETDFVARNENFRDFVSQVCAAAMSLDTRTSTSDAVTLTTSTNTAIPLSELLSAHVAASDASTTLTVQDSLADVVAKIRENILVRRASALHAPPGGIVATYVHSAVEPGLPMGRAAAAVVLTCGDETHQAEVREVGKRLCMHIVAARPRYLDGNDVPKEVMDKEREVFQAQTQGTNKPPHIVEKMIAGKLNKFVGEITLLGQAHMAVEGQPQIAQYLRDLSKKLGTSVNVTGFVHFQVGEGEGAN